MAGIEEQLKRIGAASSLRQPTPVAELREQSVPHKEKPTPVDLGTFDLRCNHYLPGSSSSATPFARLHH